MLISKKHNFIFIHIYKTAGSSIKHLLGPYAVGTIRYQTLLVLRKLGVRAGHMAYPDHITAYQLMEKMGAEEFRSFFSFAVIRNPWDWQVSLYAFALQNPKHPQHALAKGFRDFDEYIRWRCNNEVRFQKDFIFSPAGEQLVDYIARYERLEEDFELIRCRIGMTEQLPKKNASKRSKYQDYYSEESKELIRRVFAPDIDAFGYTF